MTLRLLSPLPQPEPAEIKKHPIWCGPSSPKLVIGESRSWSWPSLASSRMACILLLLVLLQKWKFYFSYSCFCSLLFCAILYYYWFYPICCLPSLCRARLLKVKPSNRRRLYITTRRSHHAKCNILWINFSASKSRRRLQRLATVRALQFSEPGRLKGSAAAFIAWWWFSSCSCFGSCS